MKPERRCEKRVNDSLLPSVYSQSMAGTATSGTPDMYYEGSCASLWVEYKWTRSKTPRVIPDPEPLQKFWLHRAYKNRQQVAVICGSPRLYYVFPGLSWESRLTRDALPGVYSKKEVAEWIYERTCKNVLYNQGVEK